ncbi:glycosyltransferase [Arthrobacter alpinus]|uniref:glycosyltransferase n=1 Tax=Arthrobacter alpinus TaxID=656366 RepID=UPI0005CB26D2|nr:glycosyltransferase [Arthrobacter alpinus]
MKVAHATLADINSQFTTAAVIAAFKPAATLVHTVVALSRQINHIVVVDDGSPASSTQIFAELEKAGAHVVHQGSNQGIGAALNAGVMLAEKSFHPDYFITLDQDSVLVDDYVRRAHKTLKEAAVAGVSVGFVCAASYSGHASPLWKNVDGFCQAFDPMQSGFFIPRQTISTVGRFAADFFIDGVDSDFTMRCRDAGLATIIGPGCTIEHDLGERGQAQLFGRKVRVLGRDIGFNYHSPSRVYYICRNGTALTKRYLRSNPGWVGRRLVEEAKAHLLRFLFSPNRVKLLTAAIAGLRDGFTGKSGRIPQPLEKRLS